MQGPRYRGGAEGEDVDTLIRQLHALLLLHSESLFLVDHEETEVAELDLLTQEGAGADHDVGGTGGYFGEEEVHSFAAHVTVDEDRFDVEVQTFYPLDQRPMVLGGEDDGRGK